MNRSIRDLVRTPAAAAVKTNPRRLVWVLMATLAAAIIVMAIFQALALWRHSSGAAGAEVSARRIAATTQTLLEGQQQAVTEAAAQPSMVALARGGTADPGRLQAALPDAQRTLLLDPRIELLQAEPYPGADFAALAVALRAKEEGATAGPMVNGLGGDPRVTWAAPVTDEGALLGLLVVSYPFSAISAELDRHDGAGYVDLRRIDDRGGADVLASRGSPGTSSVDLLPSQDTGYGLQVGYGMAEPFGLVVPGMLPALLLLAFGLLLAVAGYWIGFQPRWGRPVPATDEGATEEAPMLKDLVDEELKEAMSFAQAKESPVTAASADAVDKSIFRAYDIRGVVGRDLTAEVATLLGRAIGSEAVHRGIEQIAVARDGRHSGPELSSALIDGLRGCGLDVIDLGAVPTGVLYFATHHLGTGSGVMVTGSHNPPQYNGFKIVLGGETLSGEAIKDLYRRLVEDDLVSGSGGVQEMDIIEEYVERIASDIQTEEPLKVVVDCGNGIPGMIAPQVLEEIGCEVVPLYCDVDGDFPNHHPDPSIPANLADLIVSVKKLDADLGVAFDGDGDRLGVVTREGRIIYPDRLLMLFAEDVLLRNPGATVIYDVKCTGHLAKVILQHGGSPLMWKTGHSLIKAKMKETGAALAGEMSGHFFFKERWYGFDDGIYAAARLLEILASAPDGVDATLNGLPDSVSTPELKVEMAEGEHYEFMEAFQSQAEFSDARVTTIDGVRADYDDGWGLVRCSNTTPCLVLRFDATSESALKRIQETFREKLLAVRDDLELPF